MKRNIVRFGVAMAAAALGLGWLLANPAWSHPTDEVLQQLYVTPTPAGLHIEVDVTPGVLIGPTFVALIDADGDGGISGSESSAFAEVIQHAVGVAVNGKPVTTKALAPTSLDAGVLAAGGGTVRVDFDASVESSSVVTERTITVTDSYSPGSLRTSVQATVTLVTAQPVTIGHISYENDQRTLIATYVPGPTGDGSDAAVARGPSKTKSAPYLLSALRRPLDSPWALASLLAASAVLGALHALTPGHGKTLLAAYLVGERGTSRHAVALGAVVTVTHTASVIAIGVAVLVAGRYVVPGVVVPVLELTVGLLVAALGARLAVRRWLSRAAREHHVHAHGPGERHEHGHDHAPKSATPASLLTMGVSGGVVPCPEALGVLLLAVAVHRTVLGLAMIVAFSAGLAVVLVGLGLMLVTARLGARIRRMGESRARLGSLIPLGSAAVVTTLGLAMAMRGIAALSAR